MKSISILGSTGSIGTQAIEVAQENKFRVTGLAAHSNINLLEAQARQLKPELVCVFNADYYDELKNRLFGTGIRVVTGLEGLCQTAELSSAEIVLNAVVGMVGLRPTLAAIAEGKEIALANKETLVTGGQIVLVKLKNTAFPFCRLTVNILQFSNVYRGLPREHFKKSFLRRPADLFMEKPSLSLLRLLWRIH